MQDKNAMRAEVEHLRTLAQLNTDKRVLEQIRLLIAELEHRLRESEDGQEKT